MTNWLILGAVGCPERNSSEMVRKNPDGPDRTIFKLLMSMLGSPKLYVRDKLNCSCCRGTGNEVRESKMSDSAGGVPLTATGTFVRKSWLATVTDVGPSATAVTTPSLVTVAILAFADE